MSDGLIEKMCEAHWRSWLGEDVKSDISDSITKSDRDAMRAALAVLAKPENVSDEMVAAAAIQYAKPHTDLEFDWRKVIAASSASLLKTEE